MSTPKLNALQPLREISQGRFDDELEDLLTDLSKDPQRGLEIDKWWALLDNLLNPDFEDQPALHPISGGTEVPGSEGVYGPLRMLEPSEIGIVAARLGAILPATIRQRFDRSELEEHQIYPAVVWSRPEQSDRVRDSIPPLVEELTDFYQRAAATDDHVLLGIL